MHHSSDELIPITDTNSKRTNTGLANLLNLKIGHDDRNYGIFENQSNSVYWMKCGASLKFDPQRCEKIRTVGWRAKCRPEVCALKDYRFEVMVGADGSRSCLSTFSIIFIINLIYSGILYFLFSFIKLFRNLT